MEKEISGIYWIIYLLNTICLLLYNKNHKRCQISIFHSCFLSFHHFEFSFASFPTPGWITPGLNSSCPFFSQVFPHSFLRPHPCRAGFYHLFPVLTLDSLPCPSSFAIRNAVETFQLIKQLDAHAGVWGSIMGGFGDRGQGQRFPRSVVAGWEAKRVSRSSSVSWALNLCSVGAAGKEQRERSSSASDLGCCLSWFEHFVMMHEKTETLEMIFIFQCI